MAVEGATTARVFETYVERLLAPALRPGQVVVMDNLGAHRPKRIQELIEGSSTAKGKSAPAPRRL
jgi:transposase